MAKIQADTCPGTNADGASARVRPGYRRWLLLSLALVAACEEDADHTGDNTIIGGVEDTTDLFTGVVKVGAIHDSLCSGALVDDRHVVTAAHCVCNCQGGVANSCDCLERSVVTIESIADGAEQIAGSVNVHDRFAQAHVGLSCSGGIDYVAGSSFDLAVITLDRVPSVSFRPIPIATEDAAVGDLVHIVGYGLDSCNGTGAGTRRYTENRIAGVSPESPPDDLLVLAAGGGLPWRGDSGGPLIDRTRGQTMVGVASIGACGQFEAFTNLRRDPAWLSLALGACSGKVRCCGENTCVDLQTDVDHCGMCSVQCGDGQTCADGECRAMPQCTGDAGCAGNQYCANGSCVADVCVQGAAFCTGADRRQCNANGSASTLIETCPFGCANGTCEPQCTGDAGCAGNQYCANGSCVADVCVQGAAFCTGADRRQCNANGSASTFIETCAAGCAGGMCTIGGPVVLAQGLSSPWQITLDATHVYWVENVGGGALRRVPKAGGATETLRAGLAEPTAVAVDAAYAYVMERNGGSNGRIQRIPLTGGAPELIVGGLGNAQNFLAQDATYLYYGDYALMTGGTIRRVRKAPGSPGEILVQGNGLLNVNPPVDVDGSFVYFRNDLNRVLRAPLAGGQPVELGLVSAEALDVVGPTLYFTDFGNGFLGALPAAGGAFTTLISGRNSPANLVVDGGFAYWVEFTNPGGVYRVSTAGGGFKTYSNAGNTIGVATDQDYVYWAESVFVNAGRIMRAPK